jgi:hypothetical protein
MNSRDPLEKFVHETLRALPERKAPAALEGRVMAEIMRRASLPWWHRSWSYWPQSVRAAFLIFSAGLSSAVIYWTVQLFTGQATGPVGRAASSASQQWSALGAVYRTFANLGGNFFSAIPQTWIYAAAIGFIIVNMTVIGVGATAYRTLWQSR